jgi:hypothetical protein
MWRLVRWRSVLRLLRVFKGEGCVRVVWAPKGRMLIVHRVLRAPLFWIAVAAVVAAVVILVFAVGGGSGGGGVGY